MLFAFVIYILLLNHEIPTRILRKSVSHGKGLTECHKESLKPFDPARRPLSYGLYEPIHEPRRRKNAMLRGAGFPVGGGGQDGLKVGASG